jgi:hypothetical protein
MTVTRVPLVRNLLLLLEQRTVTPVSWKVYTWRSHLPATLTSDSEDRALLV